MSEYNMTHTGRELDDAINKVKSGYVLPTEIYNIFSNVSDLDITMGKTLNVDIQPSDEYIKKSDTNIYTSKFACGIYRPSSETHIANVSITVGFKPKIFYMRMFEGVSTTNTTKRYVVAMIMVLDNNYAHFSGKNDGTNAMGTGGPVSVYYSSSARSDHSQGANNRFSATDTGVKGSGSTGASIYCQSGKGFQWYAWG